MSNEEMNCTMSGIRSNKISIIMPLYNAEKYLAESLHSILEQTFTEFELICVNDASTDATMEILRRFQCADNRIKIIENKERSGAAASRNRGICEALGQYITFLDGDDIFEQEMLEAAYKTIDECDADIAIYEYTVVSSEHIYEKKKIERTQKFKKKFCEKPFSATDCEPIEFAQWSFSPCNKLYRRDFISSNHLEFQSLASCNDVYFVGMALLLSKKTIVLADRRVMVYARNHNTVTRISYDRDPMCCYLAMQKIGEELVARERFPETFQHYYCTLFYRMRGALLSAKRSDTAESFYSFLREEGLKCLQDLGSCYYKRIDSYVLNLLENYKRQDFSSEWYRYESTFAYYLDKNTEKVEALFQTYQNKNMRIALWGAGANARVLLNFLAKHSLEVAEIVDRDDRKQGTMLGEYRIKRPEDILGKVQVVIVYTSSIYHEIIAELEGKNMEVVSLDEYLEV